MAHAFERAGLGIAPFHYVGMYEKVYVAFPGAPAQPSGTCDYCGNGIRYCCQIQSADGKKFIVGTDCVAKVNAESNVANVKTMESDAKKLAREKRQAKAAAKRAQREVEYQAKLQEQRDRNGGMTDWEAKRASEKAERDAAIQAAQAIYTVENKWLIDVLIQEPGDFCRSIASDLKMKPLSSFSPKAIGIIGNIFAKAHGRGGSKANQAAWELFQEKLDGETTASH